MISCCSLKVDLAQQFDRGVFEKSTSKSNFQSIMNLTIGEPLFCSMLLITWYNSLDIQKKTYCFKISFGTYIFLGLEKGQLPKEGSCQTFKKKVKINFKGSPRKAFQAILPNLGFFKSSFQALLSFRRNKALPF